MRASFKGLVLIGHQPPSMELCTYLLGLILSLVTEMI